MLKAEAAVARQAREEYERQLLHNQPMEVTEAEPRKPVGSIVELARVQGERVGKLRAQRDAYVTDCVVAVVVVVDYGRLVAERQALDKRQAGDISLMRPHSVLHNNIVEYSNANDTSFTVLQEQLASPLPQPTQLEMQLPEDTQQNDFPQTSIPSKSIQLQLQPSVSEIRDDMHRFDTSSQPALTILEEINRLTDQVRRTGPDASVLQRVEALENQLRELGERPPPQQQQYMQPQQQQQHYMQLPPQQQYMQPQQQALLQSSIAPALQSKYPPQPFLTENTSLSPWIMHQMAQMQQQLQQSDAESKRLQEELRLLEERRRDTRAQQQTRGICIYEPSA